MNVRFAASFACGLALAAGCGSSSTGEDIAPIVDSLSRDKSPLAGGAEVIVYGEGFVFNAATPNRVLFGDRMAMFVETISDSELRVITPPQAEPGPVDIIVYNSNGFSTLGGSFTYNPLPTVTSISPENGSPAGGTTVTITGTGFAENDAGENLVWIGETEVREVTVVDDTTIEVVSPPGQILSILDVVIANENGSATLSPGFKYRPRGILGLSTYQNSESSTFGYFWDAEADIMTALPRVARGGPSGDRYLAAFLGENETIHAARTNNFGQLDFGVVERSGQFRVIGGIGPYFKLQEMALLPSGEVWAVIRNAGGIGTIDVETGAFSLVEAIDTQERGWGLGVHAGTVYFTRASQLFTVNTDNGALDPDPVTMETTRVGGMASFGGALYAVAGAGCCQEPTPLVTIDPADGSVEPIALFPEQVDAIIAYE